MRLVWFPVDKDELAGTEQTLGTALPTRYKAALLDQRVRAILSHQSASSFWAGMTMAQFAGFTAVLRAQQAELPPGAVVAAAVVDHETGAPVFRGYWRIWLPEKDQPRQLGPVLYSWDAVKRRKTRDCTVDAWVDTVVRVVAAADPAHLEAVGFPQPAPERKEKPFFHATPLERAKPATVSLRGGTWCICDGATLPVASGLVRVRAPAGNYAVELKMARTEQQPGARVAAVRLVLLGAKAERTQPQGHVDVDHAVVALHDRDAFIKAVPSSQRDRAGHELENLQATPCVVDVKGRAQFVLVPSGRGDGTYPVNALLDGNGAVVGVEVLFIP